MTESETLRRRIRELEREIEETRSSLAEEHAANQALQAGQVDAIVDPSGGGALLLQAAQTALRESEERYKKIVETTTEGICSIDAEFRITFANGAFARMLGCTPEELIGAPSERYTFSGELGESRGHLDTRRQGVAEEYERRLRRKDGKECWALVSGAPILDSDGRFAGSFGMFTDITERRRAAEMLRESEERIRFTLRSANVGIWDMDAATGAAQWSEILENQYGLEPGTFAGSFGAFVERIHPDDRLFVQAAVEKALKSGGDFSVEHRAIRPDGTVRTMNNIGHVYFGEQGAPRAVGISIDITDQRRLEEQFRQSQKMDAVGRLAGGVAHDFNNLLTVMLGYSDVLLQAVEPGPMKEAAQEIRRAGERAAALTRQLLAFSRKQTLVPEVLDLGAVVSGLSTMVERLIGEDIKVRVVVPPNLGRVKADRGQLEQVVMNLAVNARDAMPNGGSLIFELQNVELEDAYAATHAEVRPGPYVLLAISDTGTGMDVKTQKHIFEPFFTTKEAGKGTGLGLSTVHGIVHQSGGAITVYSEPGRGTTFKVYLPRIAGDVVVPRSGSGIRPALPTGSETVLVVEDETAIRQLTRIILERAGYTVLLAESPAAAERIAGSHPGPIHALLTDVVMPGMKGPELAERLIGLRPDLRVLYMSGYTDDAIAHHGFLDAGMEFLQKPFTPLGLMQKIREVLDRSDS